MKHLAVVYGTRKRTRGISKDLRAAGVYDQHRVEFHLYSSFTGMAVKSAERVLIDSPGMRKSIGAAYPDIEVELLREPEPDGDE
ncbi:MAG: hypothetical protein DRJ65_19540 [Acidobacteria bacterium]|nr:MAG: hypothetical protein DRJ65_19540 [Acidobacteriota bacterium]